MKKIFGNVKNSNVNSATEKDLRGTSINVGGISVTIENKIAEGGFSFVYVVRCQKSGRLYALKRQFVNEQRLLEACRREIEITRTLGSHSNIVTYVASSLQPLSDGVHEYLLLTNFYRNSVLQLMNERLAAGRNLNVSEIVQIFCDVCSAVARLHHCQTPVIHRDLKVENLLLDSDGVCVLCDFGSATTRVLSTQTHSYGVVEEEISRFTTLSYRSPEMVDLYSSVPITTKADIWALGVMLFKLCYFSLPFGESVLAIQNAIFTFPSEPEYPQEIQALIVYLLTTDVQIRPDIYQVASTIFSYAKRSCPVKNLHNSQVPSLGSLIGMLHAHQNRNRTNVDLTLSSSSNVVQQQQQNYASSVKSAESGLKLTSESNVTTSVVPRQRPKVQPVSSPALPLVASTVDPVGPWKQTKKSASPNNQDDGVASTASFKENISDNVSELTDTASTSRMSTSVGEKSSNGGGGSTTRTSSCEGAGGSGGGGHRRNISDPSATAISSGGDASDRCSAFRPYHSQQQVASSVNHESSKHHQRWNPFDLDDHSFGLHFDELPRRRGSTSSTANVKSRESLVMTAEEDADPFGAAPFTLPPTSTTDRTKFTNSTSARLSADNVEEELSVKKSRYRKLINCDVDIVDAKNRLHVSTRNELEDVDSVGSASDLQARMMQAGSTTDDDEEGGSDADDVGGGGGDCGGYKKKSPPMADDCSSNEEDETHLTGKDAIFVEPSELLGRRPLLADDEDELTDLAAETFEMNILSPGSTDTMIGLASPIGTCTFSETSVSSTNVFLEAPFDSSTTTTTTLNFGASNSKLTNNVAPIAPSRRAKQQIAASAEFLHYRQKQSNAIGGVGGGGGEASKNSASFINTTFQGDDAFRT